VFVCTRNSARSQPAASPWNDAAAVPATSAGTHPAPRVHPGAIEVARRSQMAAALPAHHARGTAEVRSAGSAPADEIDPAVRDLPDPAGQTVERVRPVRDDIDRLVRALPEELTPPPAR